MARKRSMMKKQIPVNRSLVYGGMTPAPGGAQYTLDIFKDLSALNRKLFPQGRCAYIESIEVLSDAGAEITYEFKTAGNTWITQNSFVKSKAMWDEMQQLVLADNPSVSGTWHDYKIYLDAEHEANPSQVITGLQYGEWNYSTFVLPEHTVDPATGQPLPATEVNGLLLGNDTSTGRGLVKAYAQSRATVQPTSPAVNASLSTSFFSLLTDSGSQEPELADVIEDENDEPPYPQANYVGGVTNLGAPVTQSMAATSVSNPHVFARGFEAECGLVRVLVSGPAASTPIVVVHLRAGTYKGIKAPAMGQ